LSLRAESIFSELYLRGLFHRLAVLTNIKEFVRRESERRRKQARRDLLDASIVFLNGIVEETPRRRDLVLDVGQLSLQVLKVAVALGIRIALCQREQWPQRPAKRVLRSRLRGRALRVDRSVASRHHRLQRAALVRRIALHGLDQIGNEVVALLELHV